MKKELKDQILICKESGQKFIFPAYPIVSEQDFLDFKAKYSQVPEVLELIEAGEIKTGVSNCEQFIVEHYEEEERRNYYPKYAPSVVAAINEKRQEREVMVEDKSSSRTR